MPLAAVLFATLMVSAAPTQPEWVNIPKRFRGQLVVARPKGFSEKIVALTFDDGPDPKVTPMILDTLRKFDAKATFFVLGANAVNAPELVQRIHREGHGLGNHTWNHPSKANEEKAASELNTLRKLVKENTGYTPILFRPPYGITKNAMTPMAKRQMDVVVIWTASSADTATKSVEKVYKNVAYTPNPGEIVLMHDGYGKTWTAAALPKILERLRKKGFKFVTVAEMLRRYDAYLTKYPDRVGTRHWGL